MVSGPVPPRKHFGTGFNAGLDGRTIFYGDAVDMPHARSRPRNQSATEADDQENDPVETAPVPSVLLKVLAYQATLFGCAGWL